jgi:arylamine N-acetyltransferase
MHIPASSPLSLEQSSALCRFSRRFGLDDPELDNDLLLERVCSAFAQLPFENLTKIISASLAISHERSLRLPPRVLEDFLAFGTGGTCFSLNAAFIAVLSHFGFEAYPLLCDRHYGQDTHCAVLLVCDGVNHVVDPGYLLYQPCALPTTVTTRHHTGFSELELQPAQDGAQVMLTSIVNGQRRYRLTYKVAIVDEQQFLDAWKRSFTFDMMSYPVITFCKDGRHIYLQGSTLRVRGAEGLVTRELTLEEQRAFIVTQCGIDERVFTQALPTITHGNSQLSPAR